MTTSGTATYNPLRDKVIYGALRLCGAYPAHSVPRVEQIEDAKDALDMMLKGWSMEGFLFLKQFIYVTLAASQGSYTLGPGTTDTVTTDAAGLVAYTQKPTRVWFPTRYTISTTGEVPMRQISREEWTALPNKATTGTPVHAYYDPKISTGVLYVWPTPIGATEKVILTVDRSIEDVGTDETTFDLPPEALEMLKYNLALRLSLEYGLSQAQIANLERYAVALKDIYQGYQRDNASVYITPDSGWR